MTAGGWVPGPSRGPCRRGRGAPFAAALVGAGLILSGCSGDLFHDTSWAESAGGAPGASSTSGGAGEGGGGGEGGGASSCPEGASPLDEPCAIDEARGFFVRLEGADDADGSREQPFATLGRGLEAAASAEVGRRSVFVCAQTFAEAIEVPAGVALVGGLDCGEDGWPLGGDGVRAVLEGAPGEVPLRLAAGEGETKVERMEILAADADGEGASSVGALATGVRALLRECRIEAGRATDGEAGADGGEGAPGDPGLEGSDACADGEGGLAGASTCPDEGGTVDTSGGPGGDGVAPSRAAGDGVDGSPAGAAGGGGEGQPTGLGWSCNDEGAGADGAPGEDGPAGDAASVADRGVVDEDGFSPADGAAGRDGRPAQGGGGGGASRGGAAACLGAGGGGGGAGGCGGGGGAGGRGGGASLAIVAVDAPMRVLDTTLVVTSPGRGGDGGDGAPGGAGGTGALGGAESTPTSTSSGCRGGQGGSGGRGGPGGGGRGGHAVGIAWTGEAPVIEGSTIERPDVGGDGGISPGGEAAADGVAEDQLEL